MTPSSSSPERPLVSIIIPSYNQGAYIRETLESCFSQDYRPMEVIVMDGGSTDETVSVLKDFDHRSELSWVSEPDDGVVDAVNKGMARATGDIAAIQSSVDYYLPGAVGQAITELGKYDAPIFVYGDILKIDASGMEIQRRVLQPFSMENLLSLRTWIPQPSCFFRLALARELGGWRPEVQYVADTDLWFRMFLRGPVRKIDAFWACRRTHANQRDTQGELILRDYRRMLDHWFTLPNVRPEWRPIAEAGMLLQYNRYRPDDKERIKRARVRKAVQLHSPVQEIFAPEGRLRRLRRTAGCLLFDLPRLIPSLIRPNDWVFATNRGKRSTVTRYGVDTRPLGRWSSDLYTAEVFPTVGRRLMRTALKQWPIELATEAPKVRGPRVTFILPFRGRERIEHLRATVRSIWAQQEVEVRCLVVEQSPLPEARDALVGVDYLHLPHPTEPQGWRKAWAYNEGAAHVTTEWIVFHDADILVPSSYAREILRVAERACCQVMHLQRFLFCLGEQQTQSLLSVGNLSALIRPPERIRQNWQGGTLAIRTDDFFDIGGYDEKFVGWGGEDNEFYDRCGELRVFADGYLPFLHLWHRPQSTKRGQVRATNFQQLSDQLSIPAKERIQTLIRTREECP